VSSERLNVAILWHQHQPMYRTDHSGDPRGAYLMPWVRLHAVRDYYSMAAMVSEFPGVRVTVNLVPSLLMQLDEYVEGGATDLHTELCRTPTERLTDEEKRFIVERFFDANWKNEIRVYPCYARLLDMRVQRKPFSDQDITDLKAWFNIAWFPPEFRREPVALPNGEEVSVARFIERGERFDQDDVEAVLAEQYKVMRNVVPIHRRLLESGQIETTVSPFYHPILPLVADSDRATIDAPGATLPRRFHHPEDAAAQIAKAVRFHEDVFGRPPRGMWPSEGSVGEHIIGLFADAGLDWIATDRGVLEKSGKWGYETEDPEVLLRPYFAGERDRGVSVFFRHTRLSDDIGFAMQDYADYDRAAEEFVGWIREGFARRVRHPRDRVLSLILDGENAWGSYRNDARAFLRGIYRRLSDDPELLPITFSEFIDGDPARDLPAHPAADQERVAPLYCASWIDEMGSEHGNDLNIWIGSPDENRAWELLGTVRDHLDEVGATPESHPDAFESIYAAEGSDWFWWFGDDFVLPTGSDMMFDRVFRERLKDVYRCLGEEPPELLDLPIAHRYVVWQTVEPVSSIDRGQGLRVITAAPGALRWSTDGFRTSADVRLAPAGDAMANLTGYAAAIGPFAGDVRRVEFRFLKEDGTVSPTVHAVRIRPVP